MVLDTWIDPRDVAEEGKQTEIFQRVEALVDDSQYHYETSRLVDQEAVVSREAWAHSIGLSSAIHFELQGYMTHTWVQDQHIDAQDTLIATLTTQLFSLQGHLATALGEIRALQAREQARVGASEGAGSSTEIKTELWNLEVQGTDLTRYNQRFQELTLLCVRTYLEESDRVKRYIGGLPDSIHWSVAASKPKTMQEATFTTIHH
nr:reverse transcriptase domain-containing protein [Tanacetum cinerariifolium]